MNSAAKGNRKELATCALLRDDGWLVASLRHVGCPGDLLAVKAGECPRLIEVKARKNVWEGFRRADRIALREYAAIYGAVAELAWWKPGARTHDIIDEAEWP